MPPQATGAGDDALFGQLEVVRIWETFKGFVRDTVLEDARRRKEIERNKRRVGGARGSCAEVIMVGSRFARAPVVAHGQQQNGAKGALLNVAAH